MFVIGIPTLVVEMFELLESVLDLVMSVGMRSIDVNCVCEGGAL